MSNELLKSGISTGISTFWKELIVEFFQLFKNVIENEETNGGED